MYNKNINIMNTSNMNSIVIDSNHDDKITLLSLPINILSIVLIQYLGSISSLICFDTAYCNHANR
jgi:hypothetical protein